MLFYHKTLKRENPAPNFFGPAWRVAFQVSTRPNSISKKHFTRSEYDDTIELRKCLMSPFIETMTDSGVDVNKLDRNRSLLSTLSCGLSTDFYWLNQVSLISLTMNVHERSSSERTPNWPLDRNLESQTIMVLRVI